MLTGDGVNARQRQAFAAKAYAHTAAYDSAIAGWFNDQLSLDLPEEITFGGQRREVLRYGENPHQMAAVYTSGAARPGVVSAEQLQGKALSFNNLNDTDAAFEAVAEFERPACVIVKHANPCGVAESDDLFDAYERALACDETSAFGGIIAVNRTLDGPTAARITDIFTEVIIAPDADDAARVVLEEKKNLRLLLTGGLPNPNEATPTVRSIAGGLLVQGRDTGPRNSGELKGCHQARAKRSGTSRHALRFPRCKTR